jgi:hypothetical protein
MWQRRFCGAISRLATQQFPCLVLNSKGHHRFQKTPPLICLLNKIN